MRDGSVAVGRMIALPAGALRWIGRLLAPLPRGGAVLDLGCGGGEPIARHLIDRGFRVTGIDIDAQAIGLARTRFPRDRWLHGDLRTIMLDETFDGVLAWDCLPALPRADRAAMAARAAAWVRPGGRLLFNATAGDDEPDYSQAITAGGLIEMAHVVQEPGCGGVWLARNG